MATCIILGDGMSLTGSAVAVAFRFPLLEPAVTATAAAAEVSAGNVVGTGVTTVGTAKCF
jgi:hypothetical protein